MSSMARVAVLFALVLAVVPALATDYTVGDSSGWSNGVDYSTWAADKTFKVGDTLLFSYGFLHSVDEVTKSDYDACSTSNSLQSYNDQSTKITLDKPGSRYFVCGTSGHCGGGMKLAVAVSSDGGGGSGSGSSPSTPSTPSTTPSTPSESGSGTPSETPSKKSPTTTAGTNAAAGVRGSGAAMVGIMSVVGLALMG